MENMINLETIADGALAEKVNLALKEVLGNIQDPNTDWKIKRGLDIKIKFEPSEDRELAMLDIQTTTKLAPKKSVGTKIIIGTDGKGEVIASEFGKQVPGQSVMKEKEDGEMTTTLEEKEVDTKGMRLVK